MEQWQTKTHEDLEHLAPNRPWKVGFSHWGEAFVDCLFPEISFKAGDLGRRNLSYVNGVAFVRLQSRLTFEEASRIVDEHNAKLPTTG
jgi:hypothetical protein